MNLLTPLETLLLRLLEIAVDYSLHDDWLWWRMDGKYAPDTMLVNCNDLFWWAVADAEQVTLDNVNELENACDDCALDGAADPNVGPLLFCARIRKMRPQGCYYEDFSPPIAALFDACGPERNANEPGNTLRKEWKLDS